MEVVELIKMLLEQNRPNAGHNQIGRFAGYVKKGLRLPQLTNSPSRGIVRWAVFTREVSLLGKVPSSYRFNRLFLGKQTTFSQT